MNLIQLILFFIVAAIAGTATMVLFSRNRKQGITLENTLLGIVGAFVGQFIFNTLNIEFTGALNEGITLGEILIAMIGAALVIFGMRAIRK